MSGCGALRRAAGQAAATWNTRSWCSTLLHLEGQPGDALVQGVCIGVRRSSAHGLLSLCLRSEPASAPVGHLFGVRVLRRYC